MSGHRLFLGFGSAAAMAMMIAAPAFAQAAAAGADAAPADTGEIIVTAQKRSESVNKVPITISVLTQQQITAGGVTGTQKLEIATPGLVFGNTNGFAQPYIRGIGTDLISPGQESPVGFYLDGVYLPFQSSLIQEFGDIERVEVLKGPQGTLYGRNTTGGAVNIITRDPAGKPTVEGQITIGTRGLQKYTAYAGGSLSDTLSASISGIFVKHNGFFYVINQNRRADNQNEKGFRGKVKYEPTEKLTITVTGDYLRKRDLSASVFTALVGSNITPVVPGAGPSFTPRQAYADGNPGRRDVQSWGLNGTIKLDLGAVALTSITGYRHDTLQSAAEGDSTALPLLSFDSHDLSISFTQELQIASQNDSRFSWIAGAYYLHGKIGFDPVKVWGGMSNTMPPGTIIGGDGTIESYAGFGQASYAITDQIKIIGGLRYSHEHRVLTKQYLSSLISGTNYFTFDLLNPAVRPLLGLGPIQPVVNSHSTDPKVTLQYEDNGQLVYGTFSKGFKSGSYNLISVGVPGPLLPEKITAFEVGGKHRLTDSGFRFNWSLFHYKYKNIQINVKDAGVGGVVAAQNAASTTNKGIDADLIMPLVPRIFNVTLGAEYLDAKYGAFPNASLFNIRNGVLDAANVGGAPGAPGTTDTISGDASGNHAIRAPKLTLTAQAVLTIPFAGGKVDTTGTLYHNSGFYFDPGNKVRQDAFNIVNVNIKFTDASSRFGIAVFVNNAFNKTTVQGINQTPFGIFANYNDPRIFGVAGSFKF